jgi:glutamyl-tRNA synthetase
MERTRQAEVMRFRVPEEEEIAVPDLLRGEVSFRGDALGDFVLCNRDGEGRWQPLYNLAAVIDDHLMGITHIIRGNDHLSNTPLQILIYDALGWESPQFAHHGLILDPSGAKMSKRFGAVSASSYEEGGFLPEALVNYLALLGWSPEDGVETKSLAELATSFDLRRLGASPVHFDQKRLIHFNRLHLRALSPGKMVALVEPYLLRDYGVAHRSSGTAYDEGQWLELLVEAVREEAADLNEMSQRAGFAFAEDLSLDPEARDALGTEAAGAVLADFERRLGDCCRVDVEQANHILHATRDELKASLGLKGREVMFPIRAALAGTVRGPELAVIVALLGTERCQDRIRKALDL